VPGWFDRHQCCRRHSTRARSRTRAYHRDHPLRLWEPLPVEALQPGFPSFKGAARTAVADPPARDHRTFRSRLSPPMPAHTLFRDDFCLATAEAVVTGIHPDGGLEFDRTCFYARSGGQPGDTGHVERSDGSRIALGETRHGATKDIILHMPLERE